MATDLDIQGILAKSVSPTTVDDLRKQGLKNVLVLNKDSVKNLISQAVEAAIERRSKDRVAEEARASAEKARLQVADSIREREQALANQALLVADRTRLERELSTLKEDLSQRSAALEEEKRRLVETSKAELDKIMSTARQDASKLPELQAHATRLSAEIETLRARLDAAEQAKLESQAALQAADRTRLEAQSSLELERHKVQEAAERARLEAQAVLEAERRRIQEAASDVRQEAQAALDIERRKVLEAAERTRLEAQAILEAERLRIQEAMADRSHAEGELTATKASLERAEADRRRLEAAATAAAEEARALQSRLHEAEKARSQFHGEFEGFRDQVAQQIAALADRKSGPDAGEMETLLTRFKAGLALELTQTLGSGGGRLPEPEGLNRLVNDVAAKHVARAFEENVTSNLNTIAPETRHSDAGDKLERIRQRLTDSRRKSPEDDNAS